VSDESRVRELFAARATRPVDLNGAEFVSDRERGVDTILRYAQQGPAAPKSRALVWGSVGTVLAVAASVALFWGHLPRSSSGDTSAAKGTALVEARPPTTAVTVQEVQGTVSRWEAGLRVPLVAAQEPQAVSTASELVTEASSNLHVRTSSGLDIALFENSRLSLAGLGQVATSVSLLSGGIRCDVPHLLAGQQFSVQTPDGSVIAQGTVFGVFVGAAAEGGRTCVKVEQGEVLMNTAASASRIGAGQSWGCERATKLVVSAVEAPSAKPPEGSLRANQDHSGTLDEENSLFQSGLAAERRGELAAARSAFEELLTKYPASPVAGEARAARTRVVKKLSIKP
jgi:FecR protein